MREFFHGWQRKIGVITLVVASVFLNGWVRSLVVKDHIEFSDFTGFAKINKRLAGLETDRQSLVVLVYKVEEVLCRFDNDSVSYSFVSSQSGDVEKTENSPVSAAEQSTHSSTVLISLQPVTSNLPTSAATDQPIVQADFVIENSTSPSEPTGVLNTNIIPFPITMVSNPPANLSIETISTQPLMSKLTAQYIVPLVVIPFWCIVIPLTLISFWLLFSKPRRGIFQ